MQMDASCSLCTSILIHPAPFRSNSSRKFVSINSSHALQPLFQGKKYMVPVTNNVITPTISKEENHVIHCVNLSKPYSTCPVCPRASFDLFNIPRRSLPRTFYRRRIHHRARSSRVSTKPRCRLEGTGCKGSINKAMGPKD